MHNNRHRNVSSDTSTRSSSANATRDTRLAGRRRFYKEVGVAETPAPWEEVSAPAVTVNSPISAGVDGTQSASGVQNVLSTPDTRKELLIPRRPGCNTARENSVDWFAVTLDGRIVKTPLGQTLALPSQTLAWAIAAEWDAQEDYLQPAQMPLMTLACTALDQTSNAPQVARANSLIYLPTDTTCYWTDPAEDRVLHRKQQEAWDEIHQHCHNFFGNKPATALGANEGLVMSRVRGQKSLGLPHPEQVMVGAEDFVASLDAWHLTALSSTASEAKSFLVGTALIGRKIGPKKAVAAARVEEEFQISVWGLVEGGHDYDRLNCSIQIHSADMFVSSIALDNNL